MMGLDMNHGGHISHGYQTAHRKISGMAHKCTSVPYYVNLETGLINYDELECKARTHKPKMIIAGKSGYSHLINYARMRSIADEVGAYLLANMSHICGLMAAKVIPSPFPHCNIVTTTTYKTLQGPSSAVIHARVPLMKAIYRTIFSRYQCGTNSRHILGIAPAFSKRCHWTWSCSSTWSCGV
jgi:glycine hydroxymethyltransferase